MKVISYKFEVAPISSLQWVNDRSCQEASLEWACYVLDFLLKEGLELGIGAAVHKPEIFNALVQYLCFPGVPYKEKSYLFYFNSAISIIISYET